MLAVYIAQAGADNLRRGLSVVAGMRRGKSEGRGMGKAPAGYINRIKDKVKYIEPLELKPVILNGLLKLWLLEHSILKLFGVSQRLGI